MPTWDPWQALRDRPWIVFGLERLPPPVAGVYHRRGTRRVIVVDARLGRVARRATLAHELVHDERGGGPGFAGQPDGWAAVVARDERQVDDEVARRLVPLDELRRLCRQADDLEEGLSALDVAAAFDVPEPVARRALDLRAPHLGQDRR
ncbi:MAG TPA: hypothetical protein VKV36_03480 [Acidimicrobiales bacterium]|nr:hypothetical protein [Acidimicrobiales bacterium]